MYFLSGGIGLDRSIVADGRDISFGLDSNSSPNNKYNSDHVES